MKTNNSLLCLLFVLFTFINSSSQSTDTVRAELRNLIRTTTNAVYGLKDTYGNTMDSAKIIQVSNSSYVAVYHYPYKDDYIVGIATSSNLINWKQTSTLEFGSSQATIYKISSSKYLMAWEQTRSGGNHIRIRYFLSYNDLLADHSDHWIDISPPRSLTPSSIGTPNIFSVTINNNNIYDSVIHIGAHYYRGSPTNRDRQTSFTVNNLNSITWELNPNTYYPSIEDSVLYWIKNVMQISNPGNIGGRDAITYKGYQYALIEGNSKSTGTDSIDFDGWRVYIYDRQTLNSDIFEYSNKINSACGAYAFANPHISQITLPTGQNAILTTLFVPSEGRGNCNSGTMLYYNIIP